MTEADKVNLKRVYTAALLMVVAAYLLIVGSVLVLQWGRVDSERDRSWPSEAFDEIRYHRPVIEQFARELPFVDLHNYESATTPGYHLLAALILRFTNTNTVRLVFFFVYLLLPLLILNAVLVRAGPLAGVMSALTLIFSSYFISASVWLTTDNLALLFVLGSILAILKSFNVVNAWRWLLLASLCTVGAILVRQIHLWLCGPLFLTTVIVSWRDNKLNLKALVAGLSGCFFAVGIVAVFVVMWHGLTPPGFLKQHGSQWNTAALVYNLSLFGAFSILYWGYLVPSGNDWKILSSGAAVGLLIALAVNSAPGTEAGHWGGPFWYASSRLPVVADRSVLFLVFSPIGGAAFALWLKRTYNNHGWVILLACVAFTVAYTANHQVWQRYYEPFLLVMLALLAGLTDKKQRWAPVGQVVLVCGLAGLSFLKVFLPLIR